MRNRLDRVMGPSSVVLATATVILFFVHTQLLAGPKDGALRGTELELVDAAGTVWFSARREGGTSVITVSDQPGAPRVRVSTGMGRPCRLELLDARGVKRVETGVSADGGAVIALLRTDGGTRVGLSSPPSGAHAGILLFDEQGNQRAEWVTESKSGTSFCLRDRAEAARLSLSVPDDGKIDVVRIGEGKQSESAFASR